MKIFMKNWSKEANDFFITVIDRIKYDVKMIFFYKYSSIETTKNM